MRDFRFPPRYKWDLRSSGFLLSVCLLFRTDVSGRNYQSKPRKIPEERRCQLIMEQSPSWETSRSSGGQEISRTWWSPKVHYCIHKRLSLSWARSIQSMPPFHFLKINFNITSHLGLQSGRFRSGLPIKTLYASHLSPMRATYPRSSHSPSFDYPSSIWWGVQIIELLIM